MVTNTSAKRLSSYQAVTFCFKQNKSPVLNDPCNCMGNCVRKTEAANPAGAMSSPADKPDDADLQEASELIGSLDAALGNAAGPATAEPPSVLLRLNPELFVAAQIDESSFKEIKAFGIKSVFNLRLPGEAGNEDFEPRFKKEGITLTNYPMDFDTSTWSDALLDKLLTSIDAAQPPTLVYCGIAMRAAMIGMAHTATRSRFNQGKLRDELDPEAFLNQHNSILDGFKNHSKTPSMREYVKAYMATKVRNMLGRPGFAQLREDIFVCGQLSEEEIAGLPAKGIKSVINMRPLEEAGVFGAGVLPREEQLVKDQGLPYVHLPVKVGSDFGDPALLSAFMEHYTSLPQPILVHCRSGGRARAVLKNANVLA